MPTAASRGALDARSEVTDLRSAMKGSTASPRCGPTCTAAATGEGLGWAGCSRASVGGRSWAPITLTSPPAKRTSPTANIARSGRARSRDHPSDRRSKNPGTGAGSFNRSGPGSERPEGRRGAAPRRAAPPRSPGGPAAARRRAGTAGSGRAGPPAARRRRRSAGLRPPDV